MHFHNKKLITAYYQIVLKKIQFRVLRIKMPYEVNIYEIIMSAGSRLHCVSKVK